MTKLSTVTRSDPTWTAWTIPPFENSCLLILKVNPWTLFPKDDWRKCESWVSGAPSHPPQSANVPRKNIWTFQPSSEIVRRYDPGTVDVHWASEWAGMNVSINILDLFRLSVQCNPTRLSLHSGVFCLGMYGVWLFVLDSVCCGTWPVRSDRPLPLSLPLPLPMYLQRSDTPLLSLIRNHPRGQINHLFCAHPFCYGFLSSVFSSTHPSQPFFIVPSDRLLTLVKHGKCVIWCTNGSSLTSLTCCYYLLSIIHYYYPFSIIHYPLSALRSPNFVGFMWRLLLF